MYRFGTITVLRLTSIVALLLLAASAPAQYLSLGIQGGANLSYFNSPKIDNQVTGKGVGYQLGIYARFGYKFYYQMDFNWIRASNRVVVDLDTLGYPDTVEDDVPFHNFDLTAKIGYHLVRNQNFRWRTHAGPFLGWPVFFSTNLLEFESRDFVRPQWGFQFGTGIDFWKLNFDIDYNLHVSELFTGDERDLGIDFGSRLHVLLFKFGVRI